MPRRNRPIQSEYNEIDPNATITLEEARTRFHEYYNRRSPTRIGRFRAKVGDIRYRKPDEYILKPDSPGSAKYLLPDGPRKYDMLGIDAFPEDTESVDYEDPDYGKVTVRLLGKPKTRSGRDYRDYFREKYNDRKKPGGDLSHERDAHLVGQYWKQYRDCKERTGYVAPRTRPTPVRMTPHFLQCRNLVLLVLSNKEVVYMDAGFRVYDASMRVIQMRPDIAFQLMEQNYISRIRRIRDDSSPSDRRVRDMVIPEELMEWHPNVYRWIIYYRCTHNSRCVVRLHLNTMNVYDETHRKCLGNWCQFLRNRSLKPHELIPFRIVRDVDVAVDEEELFDLSNNRRCYMVEEPSKNMNRGSGPMSPYRYSRCQINGRPFYRCTLTGIVISIDRINETMGCDFPHHYTVLSRIHQNKYASFRYGIYDERTNRLLDMSSVATLYDNRREPPCGIYIDDAYIHLIEEDDISDERINGPLFYRVKFIARGRMRDNSSERDDELGAYEIERDANQVTVKYDELHDGHVLIEDADDADGEQERTSVSQPQLVSRFNPVVPSNYIFVSSSEEGAYYKYYKGLIEYSVFVPNPDYVKPADPDDDDIDFTDSDDDELLLKSRNAQKPRTASTDELLARAHKIMDAHAHVKDKVDEVELDEEPSSEELDEEP